MGWYRTSSKLFRLPRAEFVDLVRAQGALVRAQITVWTRRSGELLQVSELEGEGEPLGAESRARQLEIAVERAARYGLLRPQCLVKALALHRLLANAGIQGSKIRIGVRRTEAGFTAHAWVIWGSLILGDDQQHVDRFAALADGRQPPNA